MLFSSKALRLAISASVVSLVVACETPTEYVAVLHDGVTCDDFDTALNAADGAYVGDDGVCTKVVDDEEGAVAFISVCSENIEDLQAVAMLAADAEIDIMDEDDEPTDDDEFFDDDEDAEADGDPFVDEGGDFDDEDDLDLEGEEARKLGRRKPEGRELEGRELRKIWGNQHDPHLARSFSHQWNLDTIKAKKAWECGKNLGNPDIHVSVIDTGIDYTHKELMGKVNNTKSMSFVKEPGCRRSGRYCYSHRDFNSHGTGVASIVSSNAFNVAGVTSKTSLISMKACNRYGRCSLKAVLFALIKSIKVGADVAVLRWSSSFALEDSYIANIFNFVLKKAAHKGMTVVVGAGDFKFDLDNKYPDKVVNLFCELDNVICVSATGPLTKYYGQFYHVDFPAYYSNYGLEAIDVAAPGGNRGKGKGVLTACTRSKYSRYSQCRPAHGGRHIRAGTYMEVRGTAFAAAHVAGLAALLVDSLGRMPAAIKKKILDTAEQVADPYDPYFGGNGRIDVEAAICPACCCDMNDFEKTWWKGDMFPVNGCTEYITCNKENSGMQTTPLPCPPGLLFKRAKWGDKWGGYCDWPANVQCDIQPTCMPCNGQD